MRNSALVRIAAMALMFFAAAAASAQAADPAKKPPIDPVFPAAPRGFVLAEAEDAVSTNFAAEPTLNYGCSGGRSIQLNEAKSQGSLPYYADFVLLAEEAGTYELWYGGTPPGPKDDVYASYASPFGWSVDGAAPKAAYREDVSVVSNYAPNYFWTRVGKVDLAAGARTIRFSVTEKRRLDGRFFFYLDSVFLVKVEGGKRLPVSPAPAVFPRDLDDRSIDYPFKSIDDYLILARDAADSVPALIALSRAYSMAGDYLNAIKYLKRAVAADPSNEAALLLLAKNRIWKGDVAEGLKSYADLIAAHPDGREYYLEAGKMAGWMGKYQESLSFYVSGLARFPGDLDLSVNMGLTELWASREADATRGFDELRARLAKDPEALERLAEAFVAAGYPTLAAPVLLKLVDSYPERVGDYYAAATVLRRLGRAKEADEVVARADAAFRPSERLALFREQAVKRADMREAAIRKYEEGLVAAPEDIALRQILAQAYFWNGMEAKAISEYEKLLAAMAYDAQLRFDRENAPLFGMLDAAMAAREALRGLLSAAPAAKAALLSARDALAKAQAAYDAWDKGGKKSEAEGAAASAALDKARQDLALELARSAALEARVDEVLAKSKGARAGLPELVAAEDAEAARFASAREKGWYFDRAAFLAEQRATAAQGYYLSDYLAFRLYMLEGDAARAEAAAPLFAGKPSLPASATWALASRALAAADLAKARSLASSLSAAKGEPWEGLAAALALADPPAAPLAPVPADDDAAKAAALAGALAAADAEMRAGMAAIDADAAKARGLLLSRSVRMRYSAEEEGLPLRNQLAAYYIKSDRLDEAVAELLAALRISGEDIQARYLLGTVYRRKGDWASAQAQFLAVYADDPTYGKAAGFYNEIEKAHADTIGFSSSYLFDSGRTDMRSLLDYSLPLSEASWLGLGASYDSIRAVDASVPAAATDSYHEEIRGWASLRLGSASAFSVEPRLGAVVAGNGLFGPGGALSTVPFASGFQAFGQVYADLAADLALAISPAARLAAGARFGAYADSLGKAGPARTSFEAEANFAGDPGFVPAADFIGLRLYGKDSVLDDGANILTALGELSVYLVHGGDPWTLLYLTLGATWQDSPVAAPPTANYWAPNKVLVAEATLGYSSWPGSDRGTLGIVSQAKGGLYREKTGTPAERSLLKLGGYLSLEYSFDLGTVNGSAELSATLDTGTWVAAYYSVNVGMTVSIKLPSYIIPE